MNYQNESNKHGEMFFFAKNPIEERIHRLRRQMIVHSYIYYRLCDNIWSDDLWQKKANELRDLQNEHGYSIGFYDEDFKDWTGDTGMHLSQEPWVYYRAMWLLKYTNEYKERV